jgi:hypothetical protein
MMLSNLGIGASRHKNLGWQGQYERVKRWHRKVQEIGVRRKRADDTEEEHDYIYAFFQNCYHLRDWLQNSGAVAQLPLQAFFRDNAPMQMCRDICNGTKHYEIDRPSVDSHFSVGREYVPASAPGNRPHVSESWFIICGAEKLDLFELADSCMHLWDGFLEDNNLLR